MRTLVTAFHLLFLFFFLLFFCVFLTIVIGHLLKAPNRPTDDLFFTETRNNEKQKKTRNH